LTEGRADGLVGRPPRLIVFDLDGTLVDSRRDLAESANAILAECGARPLPELEIGRLVGDGAATLVARTFAAAGCPQPADALPRFLAVYNRRLLLWTRPYRDIPAVLATLAARATLAVLTNKPLGPTHEILDGLGLGVHFAGSRVLGGDGPYPRKPDPAGLRHLCDEAGVPASEAVLVGDSVIDWRTARAAGTRSCLAGYGFGFEGFPTSELSKDDRVVTSPSELLQVL
jgi:phosphoglycolate phosphatase